MSNPTDKTEFWTSLGQGLFWLCVALAMGGYEWLDKQSGPLVIIKHEAPAAPKAP